LPREVVGTAAGHRGHLPQGRAGVQVPLDVLDHGPEPPPRQHPGGPRADAAGGVLPGGGRGGGGGGGWGGCWWWGEEGEWPAAKGLQPVVVLLNKGQECRLGSRRYLVPELNRNRRNRRHTSI